MESLVDGIRISTVVPGRVSGEGRTGELKGGDLAMKLHYIRSLYFFQNPADRSDTTSFLSLGELKSRHMFEWLETYFMTCGRVRAFAAEGAPPVIKLNDAGIRVLEAHSPTTLHHCLSHPDHFHSLTTHLLPSTHVLGPDLLFSPLVFLQVTWFKCGGVSVGLSWAHILGDAFAASTFMNMLGSYLQGQFQPKVLSLPNSEKANNVAAAATPLSLKRVDPVGDCWVAPPTNQKMRSHSFKISREQLVGVEPRLKGIGGGKSFEVIAGLMWKCIAKGRKEKEPKVVTVCRPKTVEREGVVPYNGQRIGTVKAGRVCVATADVGELAGLIGESTEDETEMVAARVEKEGGSSDFVVYGGSNLTLVDMEEAPMYGFEIKGRHPVFAAYAVGGSGEEGVVVVQPGPSHGSKLIVVTLPECEIEQLKVQLKHYCPLP